MTAVRTRPEASMAARRPAPPEPTITASYVCLTVISGGARPRRGVEREYDHGPQHEQREPEHVEEHVGREPGAGRFDVVEDDDAQPVDPVDQRKREHHP